MFIQKNIKTLTFRKEANNPLWAIRVVSLKQNFVSSPFV